jgi:methylglutaconyl-CoA hydratase
MLLKSITQNIVTLTLNRPEVHNAFDEQLIQQLTSELKAIEQNPNIRVVILAANGKNFCAGADLHWMQKMATYSHEENFQDALALANLMKTLYHLNKPTIALIHGATFGGGVGLVACCDIAIATTEASFCLSETKIGLIPAVISPYVIRAISERAARRYFLTAEAFDAATALQLGLIHQIVASAELENTGMLLAKTLLNNSPHAINMAKKLITDAANKTIDANLIKLTAEYIADIRISAEGQEGIKAFLEKRKANWTNK